MVPGYGVDWILSALPELVGVGPCTALLLHLAVARPTHAVADRVGGRYAGQGGTLFSFCRQSHETASHWRTVCNLAGCSCLLPPQVATDRCVGCLHRTASGDPPLELKPAPLTPNPAATKVKTATAPKTRKPPAVAAKSVNPPPARTRPAVASKQKADPRRQ